MACQWTGRSRHETERGTHEVSPSPGGKEYEEFSEPTLAALAPCSDIAYKSSPRGVVARLSTRRLRSDTSGGRDIMERNTFSLALSGTKAGRGEAR